MAKLADLKTATTGIGSLPHHNIDSALAFAFRTSLAALPQIPIRNPWEYAVAQALEGMPGIQIEPDGSVVLDVNVWAGRSRALDDKLGEAFDAAKDQNAFCAFEPSAATSSSWQPFLWELEEQGCTQAKIQTAGPLTSQWVLRLNSGENPNKHPEIGAQIYRLVLARALGMSRRLQENGVKPVLFLDEPALFVLDLKNPRHVLGMQELKLMVQALRKESIEVGVHCCSDTDWAAVMGLGVDWLSLDTRLSLASALKRPDAVGKFLEAGGHFSFGIVPTANSESWAEYEPEAEARVLGESLRAALGEELGAKALRGAMFTPACGLALHTPKDAETVLSLLLETSAAV